MFDLKLNNVILTRLRVVLILVLFSTTAAISQSLIYDNAVYVDYIETVKLQNSANPLTFPTVDLDSESLNVLKLKFDDMEGGFKEYTYKIIHCDKDWQPSDLAEIEYMDGFNNEEITDYDFSTNGYTDYTNYNVYLPNEDLTWIISGNYLLVITDFELDIPVITRRFIVSENLLTISSEIIKPRDVTKINSHQELKLRIGFSNSIVNQPELELYTTVMQNDNWNSAKSNLMATYKRGASIVIDRYDNISFPALKEFRSFDIRPLTYTTEFVNSIDRDEFETTVLLDLNKKRAFVNLASDVDANGYFVIDNDRYRDPEVSSEYCNVIFNLESDREYEEDIYIIGAFSDWQAKEKYRMIYEPSRSLYLGQAYFKQGYYDYIFAFKDQETGEMNVQDIEGSWYETENNYTIIVYYRQFGAFYDRVVAIQKFNSSSPANRRF